MRWPIMLRSTHEKVLHEHRQIARQLNIDAWKQWCTQRDATRAAQKGLLRLQRRMKARSRPSTTLINLHRRTTCKASASS